MSSGPGNYRHKAQHYFQCKSFHVLSGAATAKGHGGVQLWVAKQMNCGLMVETWVPSTFSECHSGDHNTWFHANGAAARLDYVTLSYDFKKTAVQTWVSQDVDLSIIRLDHSLVCCRLDSAHT